MTQSPEIPPITPEVSLRIDGTHFTAKQLEALSLIHDGASLRGAAAQLGIAAPTLFNYIGNLEERCGFPLLERGRGKAQLTAAGREIVEQYRSWKSAVEPFDSFVVACTPLSEPFVRDALEMVARSPCDSVPSLIVADDRTNLELGKRNSAAVVIFDDPLFVQQTLGESAPRTFDAGFDQLLFCDRGDEFIRLAWGAQRLGFDWLDSQDRPYKQCGTCLTPEALEQSGKSSF